MYLKELKELGALSKKDFVEDKNKIGNAKYHFVIAIECCIDIANHIIVSENFRFPKSNTDSFTILIENGILDENFKDSYGAMAKFRNRLVHLYWDISDEHIFEYLKNSLSDIDTFISSISAFIVK